MPHLVLLIDDSEVFLNTLAAELGQRGFSTTTATNGAKALNYLCSAAELPCSIVVDLNMPVMDGAEFIRVVRSYVAFKQLPIIVISSQLNFDLRSYQPAHFLAKPFTPDELVAAIRKATTGSHGAV